MRSTARAFRRSVRARVGLSTPPPRASASTSCKCASPVLELLRHARMQRFLSSRHARMQSGHGSVYVSYTVILGVLLAAGLVDGACMLFDKMPAKSCLPATAKPAA